MLLYLTVDIPSHRDGEGIRATEVQLWSSLRSAHILHEGKLVARHRVPSAQLGINFHAQVSQVLDLGRVDVLQQDALERSPKKRINHDKTKRK